jgi:hypothetical protein
MAQGTTLGATLGIRGYAPDAELHACKLPLDARLSDLVAALGYCLQTGIDLVCLGYGCEHGSAIVDQRIAVAKQQGIGIIAAAGNTAGAVQFPACSPHVAAVGAIGEVGTFPEDSPQALQAEVAAAAYGSLVPFSGHGPGLSARLVSPSLRVRRLTVMRRATARRSPPRMVALAALILAHHGDFRVLPAGIFVAWAAVSISRTPRSRSPTPGRREQGCPMLPARSDCRRNAGRQPRRDAGLGEMRNAVRHIDPCTSVPVWAM